jgi:murein DD-endopeptidase MepM/ murein hydrolase activator NlpD
MIAHAGSVRTYYAYNSRILVAQGDKVKQGQPIAEAGQSGRATSPQLFFKITVGADPVDPMGYLP